MKKILFSILGLFTLFSININVFASGIDTLTFSEQDYVDMLSEFVRVQGSDYENYVNDIIVIYDSGEDIEHYDFNQGITKRDATITMYLAGNYMNFYDDAYWLTYNQQRLDAFYVETGKYGMVTKNLDTGNISVSKGSSGGSSHTIAPMLNYTKTWLILYSSKDVVVDNKVLFYFDDNFDINGAIDTGTGSLNQENKTIFEKIWNTIKSIPDIIVKGIKDAFSGIGTFFVELGNTIGGFFTDLFNNIKNFFLDLFGFSEIEEDFVDENYTKADEGFKLKLGFIYETFEILFDIFNRFLNINSNTTIINIPTIKDPIYNLTIINGTTFDFNEVLQKNNIKTLHTLYLSFVDVFVLVGLLNYSKKQYDRVVGGAH